MAMNIYRYIYTYRMLYINARKHNIYNVSTPLVSKATHISIQHKQLAKQRSHGLYSFPLGQYQLECV